MSQHKYCLHMNKRNKLLNKDRPTWCHLFIISLFTAQHVSNVSTSILRSLRLIVDLFHVLCCSGSMCVGVTLWFGWGGVVSLCRLELCFALFCFALLCFALETRWSVNSEIINKWHQVGLALINYQDDARSDKLKKQIDLKSRTQSLYVYWKPLDITSLIPAVKVGTFCEVSQTESVARAFVTVICPTLNICCLRQFISKRSVI